MHLIQTNPSTKQTPLQGNIILRVVSHLKITDSQYSLSFNSWLGGQWLVSSTLHQVKSSPQANPNISSFLLHPRLIVIALIHLICSLKVVSSFPPGSFCLLSAFSNGNTSNCLTRDYSDISVLNHVVQSCCHSSEFLSIIKFCLDDKIDTPTMSLRA